MNKLIDKPGIYEMTAAEYHADPCIEPSLSASIAKKLVSQSPAHGFHAHPRLAPIVADEEEEEEKDKPAQVLGSLIHRLMLGKGADIVVVDADSWRTNLAKFERDKAVAQGKIAVLKHKLPAAERAVESARKQLDDMGYQGVFRHGRMETVLIWQEDGIWLRAMLDNLLINEHVPSASLWDLKTVGRTSHPRACVNQVEAMGYDLSLTFHARGLAKLRPDLVGRISKYWAFMEVKIPYAVTLCELSGEWNMIAEHNTEKAIALWRKCRQEGRWPYYADKIVRLEPKTYMLNDLFPSSNE